MNNIPMPEISLAFKIEDIHKIREWNYEMTKNMTWEEVSAYYKSGSERFKQELRELKSNPPV